MTRFPLAAKAPRRISGRLAAASGASWLALAALVLAAAPALAGGLPRTPAPEGARVYFIGLEDGDTVSSPVVVRFGLENMGVAPAGVDQAATGHHHLLIDTELTDPSLPIPSDENHRHFGGGQTEVSLDLAPGKHTLQLVVGDHLHIPHDPPIVSQRIEITVE